MRFRIAGRVHEGSVVVFPEIVHPWDVAHAGGVTADALGLVTGPETPRAEILIVGCGARFVAPPTDLRAGLKAFGVALEWMDTGAACRTFNVLLVEERLCAAALIAVE